MKYTIEVEIPDGRLCEGCQLYDDEYDYCHLFPDDPLEYTPNDIYKLKHPNCPSLKMLKKNEKD